jgi:endonuclease-3
LIGPHFEQRLEALTDGAETFRRQPQLAAAMKGSLRKARRATKQVPLLDDAGAHRMLLFAGGHLVLPIDDRVRRVALRLGFGSQDREPRAVRRALAKELPSDVEAYRRASLYLAHHGASTCTEADPHCMVCPLLRDCPEGKTRTGSRL